MKKGELKINIVGTIRGLQMNEYVDFPADRETTVRVAVSNVNQTRENKQLRVLLHPAGLAPDMIRVVRVSDSQPGIDAPELSD